MLRLTLLFYAFCLFACKQQSEQSGGVTKMSSEESNNRIFFEVNEENWNLKMSESLIIFSSTSQGFESFEFPFTTPTRVADANIKEYRTQLPQASLNLKYVQADCGGIKNTYTVFASVQLKSKEVIEFKGCGTYIADYRLSDIWVLETISGARADISNFRERLPEIEINAKEKSFMGFAGCNQIRGTLFVEQDLIRFTNIIQTKMLCAPPNQENDFLKALQSSTRYNFEEDQLILSNPDRETLRFKKVD